MLSQKLLVDVVVGTFAGEYRYRQHNPPLSLLAPFLSAPVTSGSGRHLGAFLA
jgi:hypothetical protein